MARFQAVIEGTPQWLRVRDTSTTPATVVVDMLLSDLHQPGGGGSGALATLAIVSLTDVEQPFDSPNGVLLEMGFDLVVSLTAAGGGSAKEIGSLGIFGMPFGDPIEHLDTYKSGVFLDLHLLPGPAGVSKLYPNSTYSPLAVLRSGSSPYNLCVSAFWDVEGYNHPMRVVTGIFSTTNTNVSFQGRDEPPVGSGIPPTWYTIPAGQTRLYRLMVRVNDRTDIPIGSGIDAPTEWLYTVRGYQQLFRNLHGKPNYRSMGGWDGRPVASFNTSHAAGAYVDRWWQNDGANPEIGTGYAKFRDAALAKRTLGIERVIIWANSGWHDDENFNYAFRFASGVFDSDMSATAQSTVGPAYRDLYLSGLQWGLWWGRSTGIDSSTNWATPNSSQLDLDDPADMARCFAEADLAVFEWGARSLGLDAYDFSPKPGDGIRWLRMLKARYPRVRFVTELALPDIYHVICPTYIIQPQASVVPSVFWLHHYVCPGGETFFQFTAPLGVTEADRAEDIAERGYSPLAGYTSSLATVNPNCRPRWPELGESSITAFRHRSNIGGWRSRNFRSRPWRP